MELGVVGKTADAVTLHEVELPTILSITPWIPAAKSDPINSKNIPMN